MRRQVTYIVAIALASIGGLAYTLVEGNEPLLGLDLQGGASVVLEPTVPASDEDLDKAVEIIRNRVDGLGVAEPEISRQGDDVLVQLPGVDDQQRAIDLVGQTAELRFRPVLTFIDELDYQLALAVVEGSDGDSESDELSPEEQEQSLALARDTVERFALTENADADAEAVLALLDPERQVQARYLVGPAAITGNALESASARFAPTGWDVAAVFRSGADGIDAFNALGATCHAQTELCPSRQIAIEIDGEIQSAPLVQSQSAVFAPFRRDQVYITGNFSEQEARDLALVLDFGALPVELEAQQSRIVSATLGSDALDAGIVAGLVGLALVSLYLLAYYRLLGVVAIVSLGFSGALLWSIIAWLGESRGLALTLAGVTGLIVSIGVSVDSNVVYFEHLKEEVRNGRTIRSSVDRAFPVAFRTIVKADVASLIAAVVLYLLTVGQVKGFALYLGLATMLDLVATYFFMGPAIRVLARRAGLYDRPAWFGIPPGEVAS